MEDSNKPKRQKHGGRQKGSLNKTTVEMKGKIKTFLESEFDTMCKAYQKLEDKDKVSSYIALTKFVVPIARDIEADKENNAAAMTLVERLFNRQ